jgi:hypothetical protein
MVLPDLKCHRYVALRHSQSPWRGQWVIRTDLAGRFWALHDRTTRGGVSDLIERYGFSEPLDASRFLRHLQRTGWSVTTQFS